MFLGVLMAAAIAVWSRVSRERVPADEGLVLLLSLWFLARIVWLGTIESFGYTVAAVGTLSFFVVLRSVRLWERAGGVILANIVLIGVVETFVGLSQRAADPVQKLFSATGTFTNRNHFANFLAVGAAIALAVALSTFLRRARGHRVERPASGAESAILGWAGLAAFAVLSLGVLSSLSRGGLLALAGSLVFMASLTLLRWQGARPGLGLLVGCSVVAGLLSWGVTQTGSSWEARFARMSENARPEIYRNTLDLIVDHPWGGVGPGMYRWAFRPYQTTDLERWYTHVHNDYLEVAAEWGVPAAVLLVGFAVWVLGGVSRRFLARDGGVDRFDLALSAGLLVTLLHSFVDFSLYIPANLVAFSSLLALAWARVRERSTDRFGFPHWFGLAVAAVFVTTSLFVAVTVARRGLAEDSLDRATSTAELAQAIEWDAANPEAHLQLGSVYRDLADQRDLDKARFHLTRATELNPARWRYWRELAELEERAGDTVAAELALRHAIELNPRHGLYRWRLANLLLRSGDRDGLLAELAPTLELDPTLFDPAWLMLRKLEVSVGDVDGVWPESDSARAWLVRQAPTLDPTKSEFFEFLVGEWDRLIETPAALTFEEGARLVLELSDRGRVSGARSRWTHLMANDGVVDPEFDTGREAIWNGSFERPLARLGLGWRVPNRGNAVERVSSGVAGSHLKIDFEGVAGSGTVGPRQTLVVTPGEYRFSFRTDSRRLHGGAISVTLFDKYSDSIVPLEFSETTESGWTTHVALVDIPVPERALELRLRAELSGSAPDDLSRASSIEASGQALTSVPADTELTDTKLTDTELPGTVLTGAFRLDDVALTRTEAR